MARRAGTALRVSPAGTAGSGGSALTAPADRAGNARERAHPPADESARGSRIAQDRSGRDGPGGPEAAAVLDRLDTVPSLAPPAPARGDALDMDLKHAVSRAATSLVGASSGLAASHASPEELLQARQYARERGMSEDTLHLLEATVLSSRTLPDGSTLLPVLLRSLAAANRVSPATQRSRIRTLHAFASWAITKYGSFDPGTQVTPALVEAFLKEKVAKGGPTEGRAAFGSARSALIVIGRAVAQPYWSATVPPGRAKEIPPPYTEAERRMYYRLARPLRPALRQDILAVLDLAFEAGATSSEGSRVTAEDVQRSATGTVFVTLTRSSGARRRVPVNNVEAGDRLVATAAARSRQRLIRGRPTHPASAASEALLLGQRAIPALDISLPRARSTWLARQISILPLPHLMAMAGLTSITKNLSYLANLALSVEDEQVQREAHQLILDAS